MASTLVSVRPLVEPLGLAETKTHLSVDVSDTDAQIQNAIRASRRYIERHYGLALLTQTLVLIRDGFPCGWIELRPPVQSVTSVVYLDAAGASQTWSSAFYVVDKDSEPARLASGIGVAWPTTAWLPGAVKVTYVAGWTTPELVPDEIRQALLMLVAHYYADREAVFTGSISKEVEFGVRDLMEHYAPVLLA
jgi:uncharacterized phiE125 gp8 family phage protein